MVAATNPKAPSLSVVLRDYGKEFTQNFLMVWLVHLNELLNLNKPMTEAQITLCATNVLNEFNHLKISDLSLLFHRIITGQYGEFYESLSIAKILTFFREYEKERTELIIDEREREHAEFRYAEDKNQSQTDFLKRQVKKIYR